MAKKISKISKEEELQGIYDIEERQEFIQNRIREHALVDGYEEGMKKGMEKGSLNKQKEIVINMLNKKIDIKTISELTGLSKEEVEKLR